MKNNRPYKYDSKNRVYNEVKNKKKNINYNLTSDFYKKDDLKKKKKEKTPTNIRIDMNRINDSESLDTSFLEGRIVKNEKNEKKYRDRILKEKYKFDKPIKEVDDTKSKEFKRFEMINNEYSNIGVSNNEYNKPVVENNEYSGSINSDTYNKLEVKNNVYSKSDVSSNLYNRPKVERKEKKSEKKDLVDKIVILRKAFISLAVVCVVLLIMLCSYDSIEKLYKNWKHNKNYVDVNEFLSGMSNTSVLDDNYLFLGDYHTLKFDFKSFDLDYHYAKLSTAVYTTSNVFDKFKRDIYDFNPSILFVELGMVDLSNGVSSEEIVHNIEIIIDNVKENRPYADIYIESLYPINKDVDDYDDSILSDKVNNSKIEEVNKLIEEMVKEKNVKYLDIYSVLVKDGKLNSEYTNNGVYLNKTGYEKVLKEIKSVVG